MLKTPFTSEYRELLADLVHIREARGLSQKALADQLDVPQSFISKVEMGERRLDVVEFIVIYRALGVGPGAIGDCVSKIASRSQIASLA